MMQWKKNCLCNVNNHCAIAKRRGDISIPFALCLDQKSTLIYKSVRFNATQSNKFSMLVLGNHTSSFRGQDISCPYCADNIMQCCSVWLNGMRKNLSQPNPCWI
uniref:AlNc14C108G6303 protein n=1 Tax=Albugo laibachii Nc14 TaxID=890382 RepID=F0WI97_9STRA|nr:AlNc14C108G6303 [Albugo laibachii Nc14]|eukprot:CCA20976.1 AlNc14C108G6303 [Albugo laibachii Nc14]